MMSYGGRGGGGGVVHLRRKEGLGRRGSFLGCLSVQGNENSLRCIIKYIWLVRYRLKKGGHFSEDNVHRICVVLLVKPRCAAPDVLSDALHNGNLHIVRLERASGPGIELCHK